MAVAHIAIRPLAPSDSLESLTALLHGAYSHLGAMGLNYTAVDQTVEVTAQRVASGHCFVAESEGRIVGTVTVGEAWDVQRTPGARQCPWYLRRDIAHLHQLGVDPAVQAQGIGTALIAACEQWARAQRLRAIALDTAAPASHLRARYLHLGYSDVDEVQWSGKTYRTVIMAKAFAGALPGTNDLEHRCALVRALWAHVQARDWTAMRAAFACDVQTHWPVTGERFDGAEAIVRVNAEYPEGWQIEVQEVEALADGRVHSIVEVPHGEQRFFAHSRFTFSGTRIAQLCEYWAVAEAPPAWRAHLARG
jgi:GNAT superfamily N-acetyltransferase